MLDNALVTLFMTHVNALRGESEKGQTFIEYTLVLVVIVLAIVALTQFTGLMTAIGGALTDITNAL